MDLQVAGPEWRAFMDRLNFMAVLAVMEGMGMEHPGDDMQVFCVLALNFRQELAKQQVPPLDDARWALWLRMFIDVFQKAFADADKCVPGGHDKLKTIWGHYNAHVARMEKGAQ